MKTLTIAPEKILSVEMVAAQYGIKYKVIAKICELRPGNETVQVYTDDDGKDWETALIEYRYNVQPGTSCIHFEMVCNGARYVYSEYKPLQNHTRSKHAKANKATFAQFIDAVGSLSKFLHKQKDEHRDENETHNIDIWQSLFH